MTRINLVDPSYLTDDHRAGEFKEITRIFTDVKNLVLKGKSVSDLKIPDSYCLGKGHMTFFYNKLSFICDRYQELAIESERRGVNINKDLVVLVIKDAIKTIPDEFWNDYKPTPEERYLSFARLTGMCKIQAVHDEIKNGPKKVVE